MQRNEFDPRLQSRGSQEANPSKNIVACGAAIASYQHVFLDADGVLCKSDSLYVPEPITPHLFPAIRRMIQQGTTIGVATARPRHFIDYLQDTYGLTVKGPSILEEGQVVQMEDGSVEYLVSQRHLLFIQELRRRLMEHPDYRTTWEEVRDSSDDGIAFCSGNVQWQGEARLSLWFRTDKGVDAGYRIIETITPQLHEIADRTALDVRDIATPINRMSDNNLGYITIKSAKEGREINKGIAAERLDGSWVFAADGFGDSHLAEETKRRGGIVIGIEGNRDVSSEPFAFLNNADFVLRNPDELSLAMHIAANHKAR